MATKKTTATEEAKAVETTEVKETTAKEGGKKKAAEAPAPKAPEEKATEPVKSEEPASKKKDEAADIPADLFSDTVIAEALRRNTYTEATKQEKKELYARPEIVSDYDDDTEVETDDFKMKKDFLELVASVKSNRILSGVISGTRWAGDPYKSTLLASVSYGYGTFRVVIPSYLLFDYDVPKYIEPNKAADLEKAVLRREGGDIKFMVRKVDEKNQIAYADRLSALSIQGYEYYMRPMSDGLPRITNGQIVKSKIVAVTTKGVVVNACGCEIGIPLAELSYYHISNALNEYSVGKALLVKVTDIESVIVEKNGMKYRLIKAKGSAKAALMTDPRIKAFEKYSINEICTGVVTGIQTDSVFVRINEGNAMMDVKVDMPRFGEFPQVGERRRIMITHKYDDTYMLRGVFKSY